MPISLPPPAAPQQSQAESIQAAAPAGTARAGDINVKLFGLPMPAGVQLADVVKPATTLSEVVFNIRDVYYATGCPGVSVQYALNGDDLFVHVACARVSRVDVPERYRAYFEPLADGEPLTASNIEPARVLASMQADRAGETGQLVLKPVEDGSLVLQLDPQSDQGGSAGGSAGFGNPGNRYIGRYFADFGARLGFSSGDELNLGLRNAQTWIDNDDADTGYREASLGWTHTAASGIWGLNSLFADFRQQVDTQDQLGRPVQIGLDGKLAQVDLSWQTFLMADFTDRWTIGAKLNYTNKQIELQNGSTLLQRQEYPGVELSTGYSTRWAVGERILALESLLILQQGLGKDERDNALVFADLGYTVGAASVALRAGVCDTCELGLTIIGQYSPDTLPEQRQWVLGGPNALEAYISGVMVGDSGALARLQFDKTFGDAKRLSVIPSLYAEYGFTRFNEGFDGMDPSQSLSDVGIALSAKWAETLTARVSYAVPLGHNGVDRERRDDSDAHALFSLSVKF